MVLPVVRDLPSGSDRTESISIGAVIYKIYRYALVASKKPAPGKLVPCRMEPMRVTEAFTGS